MHLPAGEARAIPASRLQVLISHWLSQTRLFPSASAGAFKCLPVCGVQLSLAVVGVILAASLTLQWWHPTIRHEMSAEQSLTRSGPVSWYKGQKLAALTEGTHPSPPNTERLPEHWGPVCSSPGGVKVWKVLSPTERRLLHAGRQLVGLRINSFPACFSS